MKIISIVFFLLALNSAKAQNYQLLPDSCTFCFYLSSTGGNSWNNDYYSLDPMSDTLFSGNTYLNLGIQPNHIPFAFRQDGDKLNGIIHDSISEYLIMDFEANIDDTIHNLFSEGFFYDAKVLSKDSVIMNNGDYHHFMTLEGVRILDQNTWIDASWSITWNERGLCAANMGWGGAALGGFYYNVPHYFYSISAIYYQPAFCTTDPLYTNSPFVNCDNCTPSTNSISELDDNHFQIYPNPVHDLLSLQSNYLNFDSIEIIDLAGTTVLKAKILSQGIDISSLNNGTYLVRLSSESKVYNTKIVKF